MFVRTPTAPPPTRTILFALFIASCTFVKYFIPSGLVTVGSVDGEWLPENNVELKTKGKGK
jgi:hypothetical protein